MHPIIEEGFVDIVEYDRGCHDTVYLAPVDKRGARVSLKPQAVSIGGHARRAGSTAYFTGMDKSVFPYDYVEVEIEVAPRRWSRAWWLRQRATETKKVAARGSEDGVMWIAGLAVYDEDDNRIATHIFPQEWSVVRSDLTVYWMDDNANAGFGLVYWREES